MLVSEPGRVWTVAEAKAKLSEVLRLAETEGPQRIGARKHFVVVPESVWRGLFAGAQAPRPVAHREHAARDQPRSPRPRFNPKGPVHRRRRRMIGYLLDTNVISEIMRTAPHPGVVAFLSEREDLWLSSIVIHELEYGVRRMPQGRRRGRLEAELSRLFSGVSAQHRTP